MNMTFEIGFDFYYNQGKTYWKNTEHGNKR